MHIIMENRNRCASGPVHFYHRFRYINTKNRGYVSTIKRMLLKVLYILSVTVLNNFQIFSVFSIQRIWTYYDIYFLILPPTHVTILFKLHAINKNVLIAV